MDSRKFYNTLGERADNHFAVFISCFYHRSQGLVVSRVKWADRLGGALPSRIVGVYLYLSEDDRYLPGCEIRGAKNAPYKASGTNKGEKRTYLIFIAGGVLYETLQFAEFFGNGQEEHSSGGER